MERSKEKAIILFSLLIPDKKPKESSQLREWISLYGR